MTDVETYDAAIKALRMMKRIRKLEGTLFIHGGVLLDATTPFTDEQNSAFVRELNVLLRLYKNSGRSLKRALIGFDGGHVMVFQCEPFVFPLFFRDKSQAPSVEEAGQEFIVKFANALGIKGAVIDGYSSLDVASLHSAPELPPILIEEPEVETLEAGQQGEETTEEEADVSEKGPEILAEEPGEEMEVEPDESLQLVVEEVESTSDVTEESMEIKDSPVGDDKPKADPAVTWRKFREKVENLFCKVLGRGQARRVIDRELEAMGLEEGEYLTSAQFRPFGQKLIQRVKDVTVRKQLENELIACVDEYING